MRPTAADFALVASAPPLVVTNLAFDEDGHRYGPLSLHLEPGGQAVYHLTTTSVRPPLLQAMLGLRPVRSGAVVIGGVDILGLSDREALTLRRQIGYMPFQGGLLANLGLDANLAFGSIKVTRLRGDGSVMETAGGVYTLRKGREGWKIVANVMQDVGNMLRFGT